MRTEKDVIRIAKGEIGYRESGTNNTKYNHWLGKISGYPHNGYGYPWCNSFTSWVYDHAGLKANKDYPRTAGCAVSVSWYKSHKRWGSKPKVGAQVMYGPGGRTHTEIVVDVSSSHIWTIGGNTSGSLNGQYHNGDGVYKKKISRSNSRIYGYGYPNYDEEDDMPSAQEVAKEVWRYQISNQFRPDANGKPKRIAAQDFLEYGDDHYDRVMAQLKAQGAAIGELSKALAQMAADRGQVVDVDAVVNRIVEKIENIEIEMKVKE